MTGGVGQAVSDLGRQMRALGRRPLFLLFLATRLWIVAGYTSTASDVSWAYYPVAHGAVVAHQMPYRDVAFPYPPGALVAVLLPALLRADPGGYHLAFQAEMVACDVLTFVLLLRFLEGTLRLGAGPTRLAAVLYGGLAFLFGNFIYDRLDMLVAAAFMVAVTLYRPRQSSRPAYWLACAAGTLIKVVPAFWEPVAAVEDLATAGTAGQRVRVLARWMAWGVLPVAGVMLAVNLATGGGLARSLSDHVQRGIEIESVWATPFMVGRALGIVPAAVDVSYGAVNLVDADIPRFVLLGAESLGFVALGVLYVLWFLVRRHARSPMRPETHAAVLVSVLLAIMTTQRVLSPQYFIWTLPGLSLLAATRPDGRRLFVAAVVALYGATGLLFPWWFGGLATFQLAPALLLAGRNALLIGLAAWVARDAVASVRLDAPVAGSEPVLLLEALP